MNTNEEEKSKKHPSYLIQDSQGNTKCMPIPVDWWQVLIAHLEKQKINIQFSFASVS